MMGRGWRAVGVVLLEEMDRAGWSRGMRICRSRICECCHTVGFVFPPPSLAVAIAVDSKVPLIYNRFHRSRPSGHLLVREFVFPRPLGGFHSRMTNILGETPLGVEAPFRSYDGVMDVMQDMFRRFGIPVPDSRR